MLRRSVRSALLAILAAGLLLTGCGAPGTSGTPVGDASLVLDFTPNAIHAGIYSAIAHGYDRDQGIALRVIAPTASTDSVQLLATGRANFAILDIHDLAIARERGDDIVGIMAIVERPLAAVIAAPAVGSPRQLEGRTVGVTGAASDYAVLRSIVAGAGGDARKLATVTIGFNAVPALLSGRVAAATAFWNDEGVTLAHDHPGFHVFRVDDYGAPSYPELVLCATSSTLREDPRLAQAVVSALVRGYALTRADPAQSEHDLESLVPGLDPKLVSEQLRAEQSAFVATGGRIGELNLVALRAWAQWEARFGIVSSPPNVGASFDRSFVERADQL
jgi:putative hydroxymethylpyrimidine transport system substrate-binding protein